MSPELYLQFTNFLNRFLHLTEESFKFNDIRQLWVDIFVVSMILLDVLFNYVFIPEDGELLLKRWLFLLGYI